MKLSFIWFDMGYTLLYMQRESTFQQALQKFGVAVALEDLEREFHLTDKLFMREYPGVFLKDRKTYMPWYLGTLNHRLGLSLNVCEVDACWEKIKAQVENYWRPFDGVRPVLDGLRKESFGLGIISNWDGTARGILGRADLSGYFDHVVFSCEVGYHKPHPAIFDIALSNARVPAQECVYIGDNYYDDAIGSRKVGMEALIINRFGALGVEEIEGCPIIRHISEVWNYIGKEIPSWKTPGCFERPL
ncbi:MAG: HAD-IA family hydrolase [Desulfobacterales bacterium]|nr:MAG: HAD-IA family hydrolase [Desulfobacterales bacterium]